MTVRIVSEEEAELLLQAGTLRKLPTRSGDFRIIVTIPGSKNDDVPSADLDINACGGTHVSSTSQIGAVLIRGTERSAIHPGEFLCGNAPCNRPAGADHALSPTWAATFPWVDRLPDAVAR